MSQADGSPKPTLGARATYRIYRLGGAVAPWVPYSVGEWIARHVAVTAARLAPGRRAMVERHQQRAASEPLSAAELDRRVRATFDSYGRYWWELLRIASDARKPLARRMRAEGFECIEAAIAEGKGVIVALPHVGGWDFGGAWLAQEGYPSTVVVEPLEPPQLLEWFSGVRNRIGMDVVPLGPDAGARVAEVLREGKVVCLLCDRDLSGDGVEVEFFGETTTLPAGPATLALRTGALLVPTAVYFAPHGGHFARIGPPVPCEREGRLRDDVTRITADLAQRFETLIRAEPTQWHLMQPNWPSDDAVADGRAGPATDARG
ncbi:MAG: Lauroyl/myristoyl acyltransferase [Actinomycetia bacterium]|nr:Lauroyl/myristoyl acyltransferase [Actinomycetes bacterium]